MINKVNKEGRLSMNATPTQPRARGCLVSIGEELKGAISRNHNLPSAGHQSVTCIKKQIKEDYTWYGLGHDVKPFVS
jgi:hypothetical protein